MAEKSGVWQASYGWDGFLGYPYIYMGRSAGPDVLALQEPSIFDEDLKLPMKLSQNELGKFDKDIILGIPIVSGPNGASVSNDVGSILLRRFTESSSTWKYFQDIGKPKDSYGMPYQVPIGMATLENFAGFPLFVGTSNNYGNKKWGGLEFLDIVGSEPDEISQYTYIDYDPVTGYVMRKAVRPQLSLRVERGPLFVNLVGSQERCTVPTKIYLAGNAYGCYLYIPIMWYEHAKIISEEEFHRLKTHFYSRPYRVANIITVGVTLAFVCTSIGTVLWYKERYYQRRFEKRIYID